MSTPTPRQVRAARGTAAAAVATLVSATAHTLAGGGAPAPLLVATIAVLAAPIAMAFIGPRVSLWRTGAAVVASQAVFHIAFAVAGSLGPLTMTTGHVHDATLLAPVGMHAHTALIPDPPMLVAHLVGAAVTVALVFRGERVLRAIGRGLVRLLSAPPATSLPRPGRRIRLSPVGVRTAALRPVLSVALSRRGPPAPAL